MAAKKQNKACASLWHPCLKSREIHYLMHPSPLLALRYIYIYDILCDHPSSVGRIMHWFLTLLPTVWSWQKRWDPPSQILLYLLLSSLCLHQLLFPSLVHLLWQTFKFLPHCTPWALEKRVGFWDSSPPSFLNIQIKNYLFLSSH